MNGDLLTTNIVIGTNGTAANNMVHGVFYSILPRVKDFDASTAAVDWQTGVTETEGA